MDWREHYDPQGTILEETAHIQIARTQWEAQFERALNVIDPDTSSKLMVTTRIRGLIKGGSEVAIGTLSQRDALKLLAATAQVDEYAEHDGQYHMACEVVELCSCLALTVFNQTTNLNCTHKPNKIPIKKIECGINPTYVKV